jgi:hypothetical protein
VPWEKSVPGFVSSISFSPQAHRGSSNAPASNNETNFFISISYLCFSISERSILFPSDIGKPGAAAFGAAAPIFFIMRF